MSKLVSNKRVKELTKRDGRTEYIDTLNTINVSFSKPFVKVPKIFISVDGDVHYKIMNKSKTGFKIQFKDKNFDSIAYSGEFDWEAVPDDALE